MRSRSQHLQAGIYPSRPASGYAAAAKNRPGRLQLTDTYLHVQRVRSRFTKHTPKIHFWVSCFVVAAIVYGLFQTIRTTLTDANRLLVLKNHRQVIEQYHQDTLYEHRVLRHRIATAQSAAGVEELARNNLGMVGENEVPVYFR